MFATRPSGAQWRTRSCRLTSVSSISTTLFLLVSLVTALACRVHAATSAQKTTQLNKIAKSGVVDLDTDGYEKYVAASPRSYGVLVLLTAMSPEHGCAPCREIDPEFRLVASSWAKQKTNEDLFFGVVEFKRGMDVYRKLGLTSAPTIIYYPPSEGPKAGKSEARYDLHHRGLRAEPLVQWLSAQTGEKIQIIRPIDYSKYALQALGVVAVAAIVKIALTRLQYWLRLPALWGSISLAVILMMCSGHMWNQIRKPPYVVQGQNGRVEWIANGFQQQYVMESQIFALLQAVGAFAVVILAVKVPKIRDPTAQSSVALAATAVLMTDVSITLWLFRMKNGGYPFSLLL